MENWERPFCPLNQHHFCIRSRRGGSGSADFLLPAEEVGGGKRRRGRGRGGGACVFTQNPLRVIQTAEKGRKCDPGLITAGAAISENSERRADKEVSVLFPVGCFVRCERLNVSLCVEANCLCSEVATPSQRHTKEGPHEPRDDFRCDFFCGFLLFLIRSAIRSSLSSSLCLLERKTPGLNMADLIASRYYYSGFVSRRAEV